MQRALVFALRSRSVDVLSALEAGMINRFDEDHLEFASSEARVLYSFNVSDYHDLHATWTETGRAHSGIILGQQQRLTVGEELRCLMRLISGISAETMRGRLEFLSAWR